jgi:AmpE protein
VGAGSTAGFLGAAARASVVCELAEEEAYAIDGPAQAPALLELRDAMSLVWRVLLLWLAALGRIRRRRLRQLNGVAHQIFPTAVRTGRL